MTSQRLWAALDLPNFAIYDSTSSLESERPLYKVSPVTGRVGLTQEPSTYSKKESPPLKNGLMSISCPSSVSVKPVGIKPPFVETEDSIA